MAGYAKMWDISECSKWFVSLKLIERGMWWELIRLCKKNGDTGTLIVQNSRKFASLVGAEYRTCDKILRDFRISGKITTEISADHGREVMVIKVLDYDIWQGLNKYSEVRAALIEREKNAEISRKNPAYKQTSEAKRSEAIHSGDESPSKDGPEEEKELLF